MSEVGHATEACATFTPDPEARHFMFPGRRYCICGWWEERHGKQGKPREPEWFADHAEHGCAPGCPGCNSDCIGICADCTNPCEKGGNHRIHKCGTHSGKRGGDARALRLTGDTMNRIPLERAALVLQEEHAKPRNDPSRQYEAARADLIRAALAFKPDGERHAS